MRVAHLVHLFPPESRGGTQAYVAALAQRQAELGHEVLVISGSDRLAPGGAVETERHGAVLVQCALRDPQELRAGDLGHPVARERLRGLVAAFGADLVHVHHWSGLEREIVTALRADGRRCVVTLHDLFTTCPRFFRMPDHERFCADDVGFDACARCLAPDLPGMDVTVLEQGLARRFAVFQDELRAADAVLTVSRAQRDLLLGLPGFRLEGVEPEPIGVAWFEPVAPRLERVLGPGRLALVQWGGLDPRKGVHVLLEAVAATTSPEAFEVTLRGRLPEPAYHERLRALAAGLDVRFTGAYEDAELADFGRRHDLAVFPFLAFETYALAVDEALWAGLPVVVSALGAPPERLGGRGAVFPAGEAGTLARMLDRLRTDEGALAALRYAPHAAPSFEGHVQRLLARYASVLAR